MNWNPELCQADALHTRIIPGVGGLPELHSYYCVQRA